MKNNHLNNFIFLAVLVGVVLFSRSLYSGSTSLFSSSGLADAGASNGASASSSQIKVPLFVMPPTAVTANGGALASADAVTGDGGTAQPTPPNQVSSLFVKTGSAPIPGVSASAYLVADLTTGAVFASKNPASRWPTASLTKLMTATIVEDEFTSSTRITITEPMFAVDPQDETTLVVNGTYSVADLLPVMLLPSSNVAAQAFADFYGYGNFINEMNARAAQWGMDNSYFVDPSGLSAGDESTADDFLKLAQVINSNYPQIFAITRTPEVTITEQNSGKRVLVKSINSYAGDADFIGGKTGNTPQANGNLLSVFRYDGHPFIIIVLGSNDGTTDLPAAFGDTTALYHWFEANFK
ncbi:MAG TPA: serine hydrolase [Candidatus Paceibacterota bacterium]|jgi:D-alanyl-D-alanine carboxypeptidase|nr:serine hydrolase [Candidatus Paceibacterota bacterium]